MSANHNQLSEFTPLINHIGSTAIGGIMAKPIVDILVEIPKNHNWDKLKEILEEAGYLCMAELNNGRMSFNKGYTPTGYADRVFHVHIHTSGDNDEIIFRDYLMQNPDASKEYEKLKLSLMPKFRNNRDGYTDAKTVFVKNILKAAKTY